MCVEVCIGVCLCELWNIVLKAAYWDLLSSGDCTNWNSVCCFMHRDPDRKAEPNTGDRPFTCT